ncbi:hypothetical protein [Chitinophaga sp.]|uniref:hypothetical protein n=1 Tax=Chitinophaga sp. TaxID=1869181 RepID=UPI002F92A4C7
MGQHTHTNWMPCCKEATLLVEKQLQQESLPLLQKMGLRLHLLICIYCRRYAKQSKAIDQHLDGFVTQTDILPDESLKLKWEMMIAEKMKK